MWDCLVTTLGKTFFLATWQGQRKAPQKISPTLFFFMASSPYLSGRAIYGLQLSHLSTKIFKQEMMGRVCLAPFLMNEPRGTSAPHLLSAERLPKNGPLFWFGFPFWLGLSRGYLCLPATLSTTGMRCHEKKEHGRCFPGRTEAIWHEIFQILPVGLNISMPFHSSFLISSLLPLISPLISSTHLFFLKETTTSPPLQGFLLCGCFQCLVWVLPVGGTQVLKSILGSNSNSSFIVMCPWANYFNSQSLSFLICEMEITLLTS